MNLFIVRRTSSLLSDDVRENKPCDNAILSHRIIDRTSWFADDVSVFNAELFEENYKKEWNVDFCQVISISDEGCKGGAVINLKTKE